MMEMLGERFEISPYAVILKPSHGLKILAREGQGFSPKAEYIFRKQLEEADLLLINRVDELPRETVDRIETLLREQFPGRDILRLSAKTGENVAELASRLETLASPRASTMEVDYDVYAEGEAELGWLNASLTLRASQELDLDQVVKGLVEELKGRFQRAGAEPAHLKVIGQTDGHSSVANLVSSDSASELSLGSGAKTRQAELIVNARVAIAPETLQDAVQEAVAAVAAAIGAEATLHSIRSFRPGRPVPTYRVRH